jgi:hypothetical protein
MQRQEGQQSTAKNFAAQMVLAGFCPDLIN